MLRGLASTDHPVVGHFTDADEVLEFVGSERLAELAALGTSCPDHFLRTKIRPLVLDLPPDSPMDAVLARLTELHDAYRADYQAYYETYATDGSPAMRGADPAIVLLPGIGMASFGATKQTARVAAEFYVNAINVMRGAESLSTYQPIDESEKFRIEYWELEERKLQRMPKPKPLATRVALVTGGGSGIGRATALRLAAEGACVVVVDRDEEAANGVAAEIGGPDAAVALAADVTSEDAVAAAVAEGSLAFGGIDLVVNNAGLSLSRSLFETSLDDWDLQHDVMARGSFLVSREAAKVMRRQAMGGDIIYISSKNSVFAGPNNVAYGAAKADQAHQVRLLAAELGELGIRVNGINPDGVVRGSGIFASGWGAQRAKVYGVDEAELGKYYAGPHPAQEGGSARTHRCGGCGADGGRPQPHNWPAHSGRQRGRSRVPAMTADRDARRIDSSGVLTAAAVDLGATSGRVLVGRVGTGELSVREVARFANEPVRDRAGVLRWDLDTLWREIGAGVRTAVVDHGATSVAVDSWAVDYGLVHDGRLLGPPASYRDSRTDGVSERVAERLGWNEHFAITGIARLPFNTVYQLLTEPEDVLSSSTMLLMPDLLVWRMTGNIGTERTNASTTALYDLGTGNWSDEICSRLGIPTSVLPPIAEPGSVAGRITSAVLREWGLPDDTDVTVVRAASHDTASAVIAVPAEDAATAYVSCGTWSLVGQELPAPVLSAEARDSHFTNEVGIDQTIRFLRNVTGLWLLSQSLEAWRDQGLDVRRDDVLAEAADLEPDRYLIDAESEALVAPGDMPARIVGAGRRYRAPLHTGRDHPLHHRLPRPRARPQRAPRGRTLRFRAREGAHRRRWKRECPVVQGDCGGSTAPGRGGARRGDGDRQPRRPGARSRCASDGGARPPAGPSPRPVDPVARRLRPRILMPPAGTGGGPGPPVPGAEPTAA